eukprot:TRINITY_DN1240_c0_g2_i2.p1 TRINITY_DN1240_c0_g2~~TRINITY_DN1240_c0_g2_i2.p1  ORF type:complete len:258 (+),score=99.44 TRINITY_DN1240_c0_g2_i2:91-774(+)
MEDKTTSLQVVPDAGLPQAELEKKLGDIAKIAFGQAMKQKWIKIDKAKNNLVTKDKAPTEDTLVIHLKKIVESPNTEVAGIDYKGLKSRKLINQELLKPFAISKGKSFTLNVKKPEADLTAELLANDNWKNCQFKSYNLEALGKPTSGGYLHPLMKVRAEIKEILLEMGFEEMPTNNYVESSFWNFDALFQPQQHPARDAHDTFFIENSPQHIDIARGLSPKGERGS